MKWLFPQNPSILSWREAQKTQEANDAYKVQDTQKATQFTGPMPLLAGK